MPTLETGTSVILPGGTTVQVAGDISMVSLLLAGATPAVLVNREEVLSVDTASVLVPRGAYARIAAEAALEDGVIPAGTVVFVTAGSMLQVTAKATGMPELTPAGECSCDFPWFLLLLGSVVSIVLGGLALSAIKGKE